MELEIKEIYQSETSWYAKVLIDGNAVELKFKDTEPSTDDITALATAYASKFVYPVEEE